MKKKKQMKIILAIVAMILVGMFFEIAKPVDFLQAKNIARNSEETTPPPTSVVNTMNLEDGFTIAKVEEPAVNGASYDDRWTNAVKMFQPVARSYGAMWANEPVSLSKDFQGEFYFYLGNKEKMAGDGFTFTLQNDPRKINAIGSQVTGIGAGAYVTDPDPALENSTFINRAVCVDIDTVGLSWNGDFFPAFAFVIPNGKEALFYRDDKIYDDPNKYNNPNYNLIKVGGSADKVNPLAKKWTRLTVDWTADTEVLSYTFAEVGGTPENPTYKQLGDRQTVNFKTGLTSGTPIGPGGTTQTVPEIAKAGSAKKYFGGDSVYWGFTGSNTSKESYVSDDPLVLIQQTPNQSQSPLQLSMQKLGEIGSDGKRPPLAGAKFILQAQDADGTWQQFNPEKATKDVAEVFTTGTDGKIVIKATDNPTHANLIGLVLKYGGTDDYQAFRFREVEEAPNPTGDAYLAPPAIDPNDPTNYAASEPKNSAALFTTKSVKLSGASTTPTDPTEENPDDGDFGTVYNSNQPWLPYYKPGLGIGGGGWLDSMESYIPRSNAFVMQYLPGKTKVKEISSNLDEEKLGYVGEGTIRLPVDEPNQLSWIKFENVGFYNGEVINAKISVTTEKVLNQNGENAEAYSFIGIDQANFMTVEIDRRVERADVDIEFFSDSDFSKPVKIKSYWTGIITLAKKNSFPLDLPIVNVYSINRDYQENGTLYPIKILYGVTDQDLVLKGTGHPNTDSMIQTEITITFGDKNKKADKISYSLFDPLYKTEGSVATHYQQQSPVKVEFPDPQVTKTDYTEIIGDGKGVVGSGEDAEIEDFSFQFVQQVPWESAKPKNNRTQFPTWNVKASVTGGTVAPSTEEVQGEPKEKPWTVIALDDPFDPTNQTNPGLDADKLFDFSEQDKITPKGSLVTVEGKPGIDSEVIAGDDFYNHYYSFQKEVSINYDEPILAADLKEREKTPTEIAKPFGYFDFTGSVKLDVVDVDATPEQEAGMNKDRDKVDVSYHTQMNFLADKVKYKYVDKAKYDEILAGNVNPTDADKAAAIEEATIPLSALPDELKDSEKTKTKTGQAIVTWQVPLTPTTYTEENLPTTPGSAATAIDGYEYVSAELNGGTNLQVKVTKLLNDDVTEDDVTEGKVTADDYDKDNEVVLFYSPNELTLTCDDDIHFAELDGENNIPTSVPFKTGANRTIPRAKDSTNWKVYVKGGFPSGKTGYNVKANYVVKKVGEDANENDVPQIFQNNNGDTLPANILEFKNTSTDTPVTIGVGEAEAKTLFSSNETLPDGKSWGADAGFSLNLSYLDSAMIALRLPKGSTVTYTAEIELSLEMTP